MVKNVGEKKTTQGNVWNFVKGSGAAEKETGNTEEKEGT